MEIILIALLVVGVGCGLTGAYLLNKIRLLRDDVEQWYKDWNQ